jgi:hypothetical protein
MTEEILMEEPDRPLDFYYSREKRLERASQRVRDMNDGVIPKRPGLFRTLTSTKPLTYLFISMITLCILTVIASRFSGAKETVLLGNALECTAFSQEGKSYITLKKTIQKDDSYTGPVNVAFSPVVEKGEEAPVHAERVYFSLEKEEQFRFTVPFTGSQLLVLIEEKEQRAFLKIKSE